MGSRIVDEETIRRWIAEGGGSPSSSLVYEALWVQSGTNLPTEQVVYRDTTGVTPAISYTAVRAYNINFDGLGSLENKVNVIASGTNDDGSIPRFVIGNWDSNSEVRINVFDIDGVKDNDNIIYLRIEIFI